jgi:hypothetical protein
MMKIIKSGKIIEEPLKGDLGYQYFQDVLGLLLIISIILFVVKLIISYNNVR